MTTLRSSDVNVNDMTQSIASILLHLRELLFISEVYGNPSETEKLYQVIKELETLAGPLEPYLPSEALYQQSISGSSSLRTKVIEMRSAASAVAGLLV
jgi:hypothetical protein